MISTIETRNWTLLAAFGSIGAIYSLWLPWISIPFGAKLRQGGFLKLEFPEFRDLLAPLSTAETGIGGVVDLGLPTPTWVFVAAIAIAGVILILRLTKFFETSWWVATLLLIASCSVLIYWVGTAVTNGAKVQAGFPVAMISAALIPLTAIKTKREDGVDRSSTRSEVDA